MNAASQLIATPAVQTSTRARRLTLAILFLLYAVAYIDKKVIALPIDPNRASLGATRIVDSSL
jgi:hypothetical protein